MRGYIPASRVQFKSLDDRMGSYGHGGLQYHAKGYSDTQGAAPWSLSGLRGSWLVSSAMYMRVYIICRDTGSQGAVQCSLGSSIVSYSYGAVEVSSC